MTKHAYWPCVLDSDGNCIRDDHDHTTEEGPNLCPYGDGKHPTNDPYGGPCAACEKYLEEMRRDWYDDQLDGLRMPWDNF
jgi:hypothetical protein